MNPWMPNPGLTSSGMAVSPIRNLQMISSPGVGGREIDVPVLARKLLAQGHPTWVMCRPGTLVEELSQQWDIPTVATGVTWYFNPLEVIKIARFLKQKKIQIIHAHWSKDLSNLILAARLAGGVPLVLTKHVYATEPKRDPFHDWVYRKVDLVIAISRLVEKNILETVRIKKEKILTLYNGIELQTYWNPSLSSLGDLRTDLGLAEDTPLLGYVGRLNHGKQPHLILEAFQRLAAKFPAWHLVLVGKAVGEREEAYAMGLKQRAVEAGLQDRIHFAGYRTNMPVVMNSFDVVACASRFESLGMVVVEAMAMEKAVLGPDSGGVPEIIADGRCGYLFAADRADDLEKKMARLMADPQKARTMGKEGRKIVLDKFNLDLMASRVAEIFEMLIKSRKRKN